MSRRLDQYEQRERLRRRHDAEVAILRDLALPPDAPDPDEPNAPLDAAAEIPGVNPGNPPGREPGETSFEYIEDAGDLPPRWRICNRDG
jgi:hypothetical protein